MQKIINKISDTVYLDAYPNVTYGSTLCSMFTVALLTFRNTPLKICILRFMSCLHGSKIGRGTTFEMIRPSVVYKVQDIHKEISVCRSKHLYIQPHQIDFW